MTGKLHMSLGIYVGLSGALFLMPNIPSKAIFITGSTLGSLLPDIDIPSSTISKAVPILPKFIHSCFGHRGITHSPFCLLAIFLLLQKIDFWDWSHLLFMGIFVGYMMHLIQDFFTKGGIPLFFPITKKKYSFGFFKSGSKIDALITKGIGVIWTIFLISFRCCGNI